MKDHGSANSFPCGSEPKSKIILPPEKKAMQPAEFVFKRLTLGEGERLLIKLPAGTPPEMIQAMLGQMTSWLGELGPKALIFVEGSMEFTKIEAKDADAVQVSDDRPSTPS